ncbi:hypothetical protein ACXNSR_38585 [Streptomyces sp. NC-S4]
MLHQGPHPGKPIVDHSAHTLTLGRALPGGPRVERVASAAGRADHAF